MHMNSGTHSGSVWPLLLAASFCCIPPILFYLYPFGFWNSTDYEALGLADALNMAYRLADLQPYAAEGVTNHPGVLFYLMSWLALALSGHPVAAGAQEPFFRDVVDHVEVYHRASIYIAAIVGSLGVYPFARTALKSIPVGVTVVALLISLVSTPATILCFMTTGFEPLSATNAFAADLAARPDTNAPVYVHPGYNWTGFYIGGNVGYSWGPSRDTATLANGARTILFSDTDNRNMDGIVTLLPRCLDYVVVSNVRCLKAAVKPSGGVLLSVPILQSVQPSPKHAQHKKENIRIRKRA